MENQFTRTQMLLGIKAVEKLSHNHVAIFGVGGVGGYVTEALARSGVGHIDVIDNDTVAITNLNRQIYALHSTLGQLKVDVAERRIMDINPKCEVTKHAIFYLPTNADQIDLSKYDYVIDCIDTVSAKIELARRCTSLGIHIISCMGAANKMDAAAFKVTDITKTKMDPLAKVMRKKLRMLGVEHLKVVYSEEQPLKPIATGEETDGAKRRTTPASNAFVPAVAGLVAAGEVVKDLVGFGRIDLVDGE